MVLVVEPVNVPVVVGAVHVPEVQTPLSTFIVPSGHGVPSARLPAYTHVPNPQIPALRQNAVWHAAKLLFELHEVAYVDDVLVLVDVDVVVDVDVEVLVFVVLVEVDVDVIVDVDVVVLVSLLVDVDVDVDVDDDVLVFVVLVVDVDADVDVVVLVLVLVDVDDDVLVTNGQLLQNQELP